MKTMCINDLRGLTARAATALLVVVVAAACSLDNQERPALSGPSELGLAISMTASPDQLPRDGSSQAVVTLTARNAEGRVVAGQRLSLSLGLSAPQGAAISQTEVTTNAGGQATFVVTAPTAGSLGDIMILATPIGGDANNASARTISIAAIPRNNSAPQFSTPVFIVTCSGILNTNCVANPAIGEVVTFDASGVTDEGIKCNSCTFRWNFGGEATATGQIVSYAFSAGGAYVVTVTVTDAGGITSSAQRLVTVSANGPPTVQINPSSPVSPIVGQPATFTAVAVPASNHRIVSYSWNWGDGASNDTQAASIQHTYTATGPYLVSVTVKDDLNQTAVAFSPITVGSGLVATLTWAPASPAINQTVSFTATASSNVGSTITNYLFDFGDGTSQSSSFPTAKHEYSKSDTFVVKLTVTDDKGRTHTTASQFLQVP